MLDPARVSRVVHFGAFEVDLRAGELRKNGLKIKIQEQPLQVLAMLLERPGEIVTREELRKRLWPEDTFVDFEHGLNAAINKLREALGDSADNPRFVETLHRRGYRFIASVETARGAVSHVETPRWGVSEQETFQRNVSTAGETAGAIHESPLRRHWVLALTGGVLLALVVGLIGLNVASLRDRVLRAVGAVREPPLQIQSIAVLPLENLSHDPEQEYFADGMTDELITNLGKLSELRVISRNSSMLYKGKRKPTPEIARELNVDAVVEGAVLRSGNRVRVTAQLIQARTDRHLWAESYERDLRDVLVLQGEVARAIAEEVRIKLTPQEQLRLIPTRPVDPEAFEAYLKGRYYLNSWTREGVGRAIGFFNRALEREPGYALAYAGLAEAYVYGTYSAKDAGAQKARDAALKAVALDESLAEAHACLGLVRFHFDWDWSAAERHLRRAVELNPNSPLAHDYFATYLLAMRRFEEALHNTQRSHELDPLSPIRLAVHGSVFYYLGQYDHALEEWRSAVDMSPNSPLAHSYQGFAYLQKGMNEEAVATTRNGERLSAGDPGPLGVAGYVYGRAGRRDEALRVLNQLRELSMRESVPASAMAWVHAGLGQKDEAFRLLEKAHQRREYALAFLKLWPVYDPLRSDPRFQDLVRRMNFPP